MQIADTLRSTITGTALVVVVSLAAAPQFNDQNRAMEVRDGERISLSGRVVLADGSPPPSSAQSPPAPSHDESRPGG